MLAGASSESNGHIPRLFLYVTDQSWTYLGGFFFSVSIQVTVTSFFNSNAFVNGFKKLKLDKLLRGQEIAMYMHG